MEWNRTVDRAIVSGVPEAELLELKKVEIMDRVKKSVEQNGKKPEMFGDIVRAAVALLARLIAKIMQKVTEMAEKVIDKVADIREAPKETESHIQAEDEPIYQPERGKILFPFNQNQKADVQNKAEQPQQKNAAIDKKSVTKQVDAEHKFVLETKQSETERPPKPQPSALAAKYPRLKEIKDRLKEQNRAIFEREKKRDKLKKEQSECTGIFKSGRRKELQQEIDVIDRQISNMKKRLSYIVKEYGFDTVQAFNKEFNASKREHFDYKEDCVEWDKTYGDKASAPTSIRERIRQHEQTIKERETERMHQVRQKNRGAR